MTTINISTAHLQALKDAAAIAHREYDRKADRLRIDGHDKQARYYRGRANDTLAAINAAQTALNTGGTK